MRPLPRDSCDRDAEPVARQRLGKLLARRVGGHLRVGRIVEAVEYLGPHDLASPSARGRTPRNATLSGPSGHVGIGP